jgi:hypothetical protein
MPSVELSPFQAMNYLNLQTYRIKMSDALKKQNRKMVDEKVIALLRKGRHPLFIASECGCSENKVYSIRRKLLENGEELLGRNC